MLFGISCGDRHLSPSCPALCRASTSFFAGSASKAWMAGTSPAMTQWIMAEALLLKRHAAHGLEIAVPDLLLVGLRHVDAFEDADGLARVHCALFRIERAVGGEHDFVEVKEGEARMHRRFAGEGGGVGVEHVLEVIERALLQAL